MRQPLLVWVVLATTLVACAVGERTVAGFHLTGWSWVATLIFSFGVIFAARDRLTAPWHLWLPWVALVGVYLVWCPQPGAMQYSVQLLCPLGVGLAASSLRPSDGQVADFFIRCRWLCVALWVIVVVNVPILLHLRLPGYSTLAAQAMTATLLGCIFVVSYAYGRRLDVAFYLVLLLIPIVALTRMAMAAALAVLALTFAPLKLHQRVKFLLIVVVLALVLFYTPRIQRAMFRSGAGTLTDVTLDNPDLRTSGRSVLWDLVITGFWYRPWFGHGPNGATNLLIDRGLKLRHPHNDWLRLLYDFGIIGASIYALTLLLQVGNLLWRARRATGPDRVLFHAAASSFLPFVVIMFTDNIILYCQFFGNLQFLLLGLAYGTAARRQAEAARDAAPGPPPMGRPPGRAPRALEP